MPEFAIANLGPVTANSQLQTNNFTNANMCLRFKICIFELLFLHLHL